ncbi:hypothetical protein [Natronolimnobius baerhuensis]|uniref:DUF7988 domain-containing protein n=1 Tax=Natronolimnobius baerhuensis TaxID=253108 RepID=A0A202EDE3_9EURY|nr:hypothetical protein [Natronolimnobius baerhuensis]OVE86227.1 hypothetical protein B2G88_05435 [Natronolimnobius baerhuensis]
MSYPVREARQRIQTAHRPTIAAINDCAIQVAAPWDTARTTNPDAVVGPFRDALEERGLLETLASLLVDVVEALDYECQGSPVPAPPYVIVTSRGPMVRATIDPGRLVIRFDAFEVLRDSDPERSPTYHRCDGVTVDVSLE